MHDNFEARNELEQQLLGAQEGKLSSDDFMHYLMETQVFMPVKDSIGIAGFSSSDKAMPLTVRAEDGTEVLIL
ncbi:MAG TPA: SseB family protein, partial [Gammaproteobacteria bacterium]|nr:SseB family protein [Gammaproteobacteria bacterium]